MRLSNYAHYDPKLSANGLSGGGKTCKVHWDKYANNLGLLKSDAAVCRARIIENGSDSSSSMERIKDIDRLVDDMYNFKFQDIIMSNYHSRCALTGMSIPGLIVGCHIVPSSINEEDHLKASNGICLTFLHAKAFVDGLIGFDADYRLHISPELKKFQFKNGYSTNFKRYENKMLSLGDITLKPNPEFLDWHLQTVFRRS
jgi:putative restriction endonuclease